MLRTLIVVGADLASAAAAALPWKAGVALGAGVGRAAWRLLPSTRRRALDNLAIAFPERSQSDRERIGRDSLANLGRGAMELLMLTRRTRTPIEQWCEFEGEPVLRRALEAGRGVIFVTAHTGNWELLAAVVARRGYPSSVVATPVYDQRLDDRLVAARAAQGLETIHRGSRSAARQLLSALRRNAVLGMLIDQDTDVDGAFVPFFGRPAYTPIGAAALALRTGASVVCGFLVREGTSRHRLIVDGPIELVRTGEIERDIEVNTARFTALLEGHIRAHPDQWIWFHRRWNRRPSALGRTAEPPAPARNGSQEPSATDHTVRA